tara:strand:+ start:243 stop:455 length:213 start_codon:yes stop_codon:yes gene_type:complete
LKIVLKELKEERLRVKTAEVAASAQKTRENEAQGRAAVTYLGQKSGQQEVQGQKAGAPRTKRVVTVTATA